MSLEDLGNIGEFVAALAVVVSLIYLAIQIRQNTATARTSTQQQLASVFSLCNVIVGTSPDAAGVFLRGLHDPDELTQEEVARFHHMFQAAIRLFENVFFQRQAGALDDPAWSSWVQAMKPTLGSPGGRAWWKPRRFLYNSDFCRFVEETIQTEDAISLMSSIVSRPAQDDHVAEQPGDADRR